MSRRSGLSLLMGAALVVGAVSPVLAGPLDRSADLSSQFTVDSNTEIPGKVLKPGQYTIRVLDHLADRVIVRIEGAGGKSEGIFLAVPNAALTSAKTDGLITWNGGPHKAVRGYGFSGTAIEFVYPKEQAVEIAKKNTEKVPAIDPKSEGRPSANNLSSEDRQMISLWLLSATRVGPSNNSQPAIAAEKYVAPANSGVELAQVNTPPAPVAQSEQTPVATPRNRAVSNRRVAEPVQTATVTRPTRPKVLPHTGSPLPLVFFGSLFLLAIAAAGRLVPKVRA